MSCLTKAKKGDLLLLCEDLDITFPPNTKVAKLVKLIKESEGFDEDFAKSRLEVFEKERLEKQEREREIVEKERQFELEKQRQEKEFELRRLEIMSRSESNSEYPSEFNNVKIKQNPQNIMSRFDGCGDISVYLALFEKQISRLDIPKENWVMHLLTLLPLEFVNIISRESDTLADDYNHVKSLLLKRFKLTAEEFRQKFVSHRKQPTANWRDFAFELRNYFDEWIQGMDVDNFESLKELIISDRIKQSLPYDIQEHFIDELPNLKIVEELVNKLDDYEAARRSFKKVMSRISHNSENSNKRLYVRESDNTKCFSRSQNTNKLRANNFDPDYGRITKDKSNIKCFACGCYGHVSSQCTNQKNGRQGYRQNPYRDENLTPDSRNKREANFNTTMSNYRKMEKEIQINGTDTKCLIDTGSELNLVNYDTYVKVGSPELLRDDVKLSGIAKEIVEPLGYFPAEFSIDGITFSTNVYVVQDLAHEIVLGIEAINKLNLSIDEHGLKVSGKRENVWIGYIRVTNKFMNKHKKSSRIHDYKNKTGFQIGGKNRVFVKNIPYECRWMELKDLFREKVGDVSYVELFEDEQGKFKGCGVVEFKDSELAKKAVELMNKHEIRGRLLSVKLDSGEMMMERRPTSSRPLDRDYMRPNEGFANDFRSDPPFNTYGLNPEFLKSLGINGPLNNKVFISNLDYKVTEKKLEEIFKIAGKLVKVELNVDNEGKSKGHGTAEYEHPLEAVQAISMFNGQRLYARIMNVRMDKFADDGDSIPTKLPSGLHGIGKGLGINGQPMQFHKTASGVAPAGSFGFGMGMGNGMSGGGKNRVFVKNIPYK